MNEGHDTIILAGAEYGSGSSRDWAAKGPMLLVSIIYFVMLFDFSEDYNTMFSQMLEQGVKAVIAKSFERIHRSNLVGMGIIPMCFKPGQDAETLGLTGYERFSINLPSSVKEIRPGQDVTVVTDNGKSFVCVLRFDTEVDTFCS